MKRFVLIVAALALSFPAFAQTYVNQKNRIRDVNQALSLSLYEDGNGNKALGLYVLGTSGDWPHSPAKGQEVNQVISQSFYENAAGEGALGVFLISPPSGGTKGFAGGVLPAGSGGGYLMYTDATDTWSELETIKYDTITGATIGLKIGDNKADGAIGFGATANGTYILGDDGQILITVYDDADDATAVFTVKDHGLSGPYATLFQIFGDGSMKAAGGVMSDYAYISTSAYAVPQNVIYIIADDDAAGSAIAITLPDPTNLEGRAYSVKKYGSSYNVTVNIDAGAPGARIDGSTTKVLTSQYEAYTFFTDGKDYFIY